MKRTLYRVARAIRHVPILRRMDWMWNSIRRPFHSVLSLGDQGVPVRLSGLVPARIPAEATGWHPWESADHEGEAISRYVRWVEQHPGGMVVDIGCSLGLYSLLALSAAAEISVIAIDSDAPSLGLTSRLVRHTANRNIRLVHCFVGPRSTAGETLAAALQRTREEVSAIPPNTPTQYRSLPASGGSAIPVLSLDDLLAHEASNRPLLIKCDVEGAERLVLDGARWLLRERRPTILLSVHPPALPQYGTTTEDVSQLLANAGYHYRLIAEDHEEHWWCEPTDRPSPLG